MILREEALNIIIKVIRNNLFSDKLLGQSIKKLRDKVENPDLLYVLVKGVIKMRGNLDYIVQQFTEAEKYKNTDIRIKCLLYLAFYQLIYCDSIPEHAAVNESVELAKKLFKEAVANFVNAVLREYQRNPKIVYPEDVAQRIAYEHSYPVFIIEQWLKRMPEDQVEYLAMYYNEAPKLNLRVNQLATNKKKLIAYFAKKNVQLMEHNACVNMMTSEQASDILNDVAFDEGYFTVQDVSSAMVIDLLDPKENESILDLFAGRGGKAGYIAELMKNTGEIVAVDKIPNKAKEMKKTMERLGANNVKIIVEDAFKFGPVAPAYDRVLIDVPCSGWGVFQKKAELRWQERQNIDELIKLQEKALQTASQFVKPGGYLVYSTCTINDDENEAQIEKFLSQNKSFELIDAASFIPPIYVNNKYLKTVPHIHHIDGAFAAKMRKQDN
ncbi:MAG: 16S rRNA (cytosine(967)-C(5))-methyltransferase RsmB [Candidatus Cloacimonadales bacterium]|jgi:16S rRNA (cytosine967-C5)-methyltransferase|nr:16S rRNA (cytosine(967)-C(5))-methyltransferase RsmB [Candidatus Cloacimonadota bacterium]MDD2649917.1 16S rRNA (cytosine(967)-C(5))-methyltransferase RsmB [Candidatus Cloacimonadota bacterium]MDD3502262.1 16S rRNA (cytosine(967)-C(5))-methyltransferase RsmB [Candidatus Cloacimonadota bacterium]MDX9976522.1 16S rRNA (cytosine(967)-C(5))-methyltransferase RsmB [Candidatus Cloacimonadales bacterium]